MGKVIPIAKVCSKCIGYGPVLVNTRTMDVFAKDGTYLGKGLKINQNGEEYQIEYRHLLK